LSCYSNNGVFCTGGNVADIIQLDTDYIFAGDNSALQVVIQSVNNGVQADANHECTTSSCKTNSVCVNAEVLDAQAHTSWSLTSCGDAVNSTSDIFEE
jgi:hypothetical protein